MYVLYEKKNHEEQLGTQLEIYKKFCNVTKMPHIFIFFFLFFLYFLL